ncbi:pectate lyase [Flavobacterium sp. LB3P122]|uniref:pectate lyase n=1 Tax=Flavobacterium algoriphilum TaxID=3398738 RepID=UPI003A883EB6
MKYFQKGMRIVIASCLLSFSVQAQILSKSWKEVVNTKEGTWFASNEAKDIAQNVLLYQRNIGGWPKNIQMQKKLSNDEKQKLIALKSDPNEITTDNDATFQQLIFLSKIYRQVPEERYEKAFLSGLDYLLEAQYENGGWPQFYPLKKGYYTHITYNDDSMVNILNVLKEIVDKTDCFSIKPSEEIVKRAQKAFDKGIDCIINTQYKQNGVLTGWCAQYDEYTLAPAKARAYELPSLSGKESAQIVLLLMSIENTSKEIINAVDFAVVWFDKAKIKGLREERFYDEKGKINDKKMVSDVNAPDIWARFMELESNTPFFCDRDGIKKGSLAEIGMERRNGYSWYTNEPKEVLAKYEKWKEKYLIADTKTVVKQNKVVAKDEFNVIVAQDGSGDYTSIQEAINNSPAFPYRRVTITVKNGIYNEKVKIHEWNPNISLIGQSKEKTIITYGDYFSKINLGRNSTFYTYTVLVEGADFVAQNLTIKNSSGQVGQAVALALNANSVLISNCIILGNQDTLYATGTNNKQYLKNCYIEGTVDFIFGQATMLFENCILHSLKDSYIAAASTPEGVNYGFVFKNCKLTADVKATEVYLGRPWRIYAKTVFINCEMGKHIKPEGWNDWSKPEAAKTAFYAEYNCSGEGCLAGKRVSWSHQLQKSEAKKYTTENIMGLDFSNKIKDWSLKSK